MVIFSLASYIASTEFDWQRKTVRFVGSTTGTMTTWDRLSKPNECSSVNENSLRSALESAGNAYAGARIPLIAGNLCLPPRTDMQITSNALRLHNPFCEITFRLRPSHSVSFMTPGHRRKPR
jgi:hypothetical protein